MPVITHHSSPDCWFTQISLRNVPKTSSFPFVRYSGRSWECMNRGPSLPPYSRFNVEDGFVALLCIHPSVANDPMLKNVFPKSNQIVAFRPENFPPKLKISLHFVQYFKCPNRLNEYTLIYKISLHYVPMQFIVVSLLENGVNMAKLNANNGTYLAIR